MCGGFLILFNQSENSFKDIFSYHFFRIFSYVLIGVFSYFLGYFFSSLNYQIFLYFFLGMFCVFLGFALINGGFARNLIENQFIFNKIFNILKAKKTSKYKGVIFGIFNGFFPCGLVYFFLARAMIAKSLLDAVLIMLSFGISTLVPMLFGQVLLKKIKKIQILQKILFLLMIFYGFYLCFLALKLSA